jgi:hypothetical protein
VRWHRRRDVKSRKADCGVRAGVLIEDDLQFQNGRTVMVDLWFTGKNSCGNTVSDDRCYGGKLVGQGTNSKEETSDKMSKIVNLSSLDL